MGLDDLLGDRQTETGILPEALFRPVGVEALEDLVERFWLDAWPVIVDQDFHLALSSRRQVMRTVPPAGENERALSTRLLTTWPMRESCPATLKSDSGAAFETSALRLTSFVRISLAALTSASSSLARSTGRGFLPLQFCIQPAGVGDIRDQAVEPLDVVLDHGKQAVDGFALVLASGRVSTAERSEVSGLRSSCATSAAKLSMPRCGYRARSSYRAARRTNPRFRRARRVKSGISTRVPDAPADAFGAVGEPADRPGDGAGEQHREYDHDAGRDEEHLDDREALRFDHIVDVGALRRAACSAPRTARKRCTGYRDRNDDFAAVVDAHHARVQRR